jgi:hypothetical protein
VLPEHRGLQKVNSFGRLMEAKKRSQISAKGAKKVSICFGFDDEKCNKTI